jgi:peptidoglycan/LPS O-acetylase OafA/YrhL
MNSKATDNYGWIRFAAVMMLWYGVVREALHRPEITLPFFRFKGLDETTYTVLFAISGYLVAGALGPGLPGFCWRRLSRIYAPFWLMLLVTLLVIGPLASPWRLQDYVSATNWMQDARAALLFPLHALLDEDGNPAFEAVNRTLTALRLLLEMDALLILLAFLDILRPRLLGLLILLLCAAQLFGGVTDLLLPFLHIPLVVPASALAFLVGAWLASARSANPLAPALSLGALAALALAHFLPALAGNALFTLAVAYLAVYLGTVSLPLTGRLRSLGTLSYGFYLYLFPCTALAAHWSHMLFITMAISLGLSLVCAWGSRRIVERRVRP